MSKFPFATKRARPLAAIEIRSEMKPFVESIHFR